MELHEGEGPMRRTRNVNASSAHCSTRDPTESELTCPWERVVPSLTERPKKRLCMGLTFEWITRHEQTLTQETQSKERAGRSDAESSFDLLQPACIEPNPSSRSGDPDYSISSFA